MRRGQNRKLKGLVCLFLALIFLVGTLPGAALADDTAASVSGETVGAAADSGDATTSETEDAVAADSETGAAAKAETTSETEAADTDAVAAETTGLPEGWSPGNGSRTASNGAAEDVTHDINFSNGKLLTSSGTVNTGSGINFTYATYTFSIDWTVDFTSLGTTLVAGDYFTFKVPAELYGNSIR